MIDESIIKNLFAALAIVVLKRLDNSKFSIIGNIPSWFLKLYPEALAQQDNLILGQSIFLENFLVDAEDYWAGNHSEPLKSGLWIEIDALGKEYYLEAAALQILNDKIILLSLGEIAGYEEKKLLIQKARENALSYQVLLR